jgi:hypothetical protein
MPRSLTLRFLAEPTDVNYGGKVHGGMVIEVDRPGGFRRGGRVERTLLRDRRGRRPSASSRPCASPTW